MRPASTWRAGPIRTSGRTTSNQLLTLKSASRRCRFFSMQSFADHIAEFWPAIRRAWDEHHDKNPIL